MKDTAPHGRNLDPNFCSGWDLNLEPLTWQSSMQPLDHRSPHVCQSWTVNKNLNLEGFWVSLFQEKPEPCVAALVRIEHMDFLQPMKIGEVAELTAEIVFTSAHSLQVEVMVQAEDIIAGLLQDMFDIIPVVGMKLTNSVISFYTAFFFNSFSFKGIMLIWIYLCQWPG